MPFPRPLTSDEIDDGWFLAEEPVEADYDGYELSVEEIVLAPPVTYDVSPQFSEAFAAHLEGRPQREATPIDPTWGLKAFGKN